MSLKGKSALVTGSTSGIGLAAARVLAQAGANVMLNGLGDAGEIEALRVALAAEFKVDVRYSGADMSIASDVTDMVAEAERAFGGVDILINNAGIQHVAPLEDFPPEKYEQIVAINMNAAFYAARAVVPGMKARGWGRIISTASAHAFVASPYKSAYVMAKHGIAGFTKVLALEVAQAGITVNAIAPGYVWTPLVEAQIPDTMRVRGMSREEVMNDVLLAGQPTKQFVTVEEVAAFMLFLCGADARSITGATLPMDGGFIAQ